MSRKSKKYTVDIVPVNIQNTVVVSVFCVVLQGLFFFVTIWISVQSFLNCVFVKGLDPCFDSFMIVVYCECQFVCF